MKKRITAVGLEPQRIDGVNLGDLGIDKAKAAGLIPSAWDYNTAKKLVEQQMDVGGSSKQWQYYRSLDAVGMGTVGCAAAHLNAQRVAANLTIAAGKPLTLILEDDVFLEDDFAVRLRRIVQNEAPCDWEAISLTARCAYGYCVSPHLSRVQPDGNEPADRCYTSTNFGMYGTLYQADKLLGINQKLVSIMWDANRPGCLPIDIAMAAISDNMVYYAVPAMQSPGLMHERTVLQDAKHSNRWVLNHPELPYAKQQHLT